MGLNRVYQQGLSLYKEDILRSTTCDHYKYVLIVVMYDSIFTQEHDENGHG